MSRLLLWTLSGFCLAAVLSVVAVLSLGCSITQSKPAGAIGIALWVIAILAVLVLTIVEASGGNRLAGVLGAVALLVGAVCLLIDVAAFEAADLCGPWTWNV